MDIYIYDDIMQGLISAEYIRKKLDGITDGEDIVLHINCYGGDVAEGWAIYDLLRQQEGHVIKAVVEGACASMAVVLLMAAAKENRKALTDTTFLLHDPAASWLQGDYYDRLTPSNLAKMEAEIAKQRAELEKDKDHIAQVIAERTEQDKAHILEVMEAEKWLTPEEAKALGLIVEIEAHKTALVVKPNNKKTMKIKSIKSTKGGVRDFFASIRDLVIRNVEGTDVEIDVEEDGQIAVGVTARPDGTHVFEDGRTIVVEDGKITAIDAPEKPELTPEEITAMRDELEQLRAEVEPLRAAQKTETEVEVLDFVTAHGGLDKVKNACNLASKPAPKSDKPIQTPKKPAENYVSDFAKKREERADDLRKKMGI